MTLSHRSVTPLPLLLILALAACGGRPASAQTPAPPDDGLAHAYMYQVSPEHAAAAQHPQEASPFIEVSGSATVSVRPDRVRASFAVETRAPVAADASAQNAVLMDAVMRALRQSGVPGLEIETFGYSLRPEYSWSEPTRTQTIDGYTAVNHVRVSSSEVAAAGRVVDAAIRAGANRVSSLAFEASDTGAAREEALASAVRNATAQARTMAAALGRSLGAPLEVRGGAQAPMPKGSMDMAFMRAEAVETPIEAGDVNVSANVTIRFALGGPLEGR